MAPYQGAYAEYLADRGYSQISYWKKTFLVSEFSRWLGEQRVAVGEITAEHEAAFLHDRARRRIIKQADPIALSGMSAWLRDKGIIASCAVASDKVSGIEEILQEYTGWLREERGPGAVDDRELRRLYQALPDELRRL